MKPMPILLSVCLLACGSAPLRATDDRAATETQLLAATQAVLDAQVQFDQKALEALLAPGYLEISPLGDLDDRAEVIGFSAPEAKAKMLAGGMRPLSAKVDDARVRVFDDQAIVIALDTATLEINDVTQQRSLRTLFHFRRIDGRWLLQTSQVTPLKPQSH